MFAKHAFAIVIRISSNYKNISHVAVYVSFHTYMYHVLFLKKNVYHISSHLFQKLIQEDPDLQSRPLPIPPFLISMISILSMLL